MTRLKTFVQSLNESYPPGAANDSRAPWNATSPKRYGETLDGEVYDKDGNPLPVSIEYGYSLDPETEHKIIDDYSHKFTNPEDAKKADDSVDTDIRDQIKTHAGKKAEFGQ